MKYDNGYKNLHTFKIVPYSRRYETCYCYYNNNHKTKRVYTKPTSD